MTEAVEKDNISIMRKKLLFRSWHRGTREIDVLLGHFADAHMMTLSPADVRAYDRFLRNSDPDIYNWLTRAEPVPPSEQSNITDMLLAFYPQG